MLVNPEVGISNPEVGISKPEVRTSNPDRMIHTKLHLFQQRIQDQCLDLPMFQILILDLIFGYPIRHYILKISLKYNHILVALEDFKDPISMQFRVC